MNKDKFNLNRIKLLVYGFFPSFIFLFFKRKNNRLIFNSKFNKEFSQNSKYLFLDFLKENKKFEMKFVINDKVLREELRFLYGDYFITSYMLKDILYILNARHWITSTFETPVGGFFLNYNRNVIHLGHGAPIKNIGLNEKYKNLKKDVYYFIIRSNFTHFFSTSEVFNEVWSKCIGVNKEKVVISPQARNRAITDFIESRPEWLKSNCFSILYAPTWRPYAETLIFPFDDFNFIELKDFLLKNKIFIYLRLHPNFEIDIENKKLLELDNVILIDSVAVNDINTCIAHFDCLITDYSSIYVDYLLTEKPIMFIPYDYDAYNNMIGFSIPYERFSPGPKVYNIDAFYSEILVLLNNNSYFKKERENANRLLNKFQREHCSISKDLVLEILNNQV